MGASITPPPREKKKKENGMRKNRESHQNKDIGTYYSPSILQWMFTDLVFLICNTGFINQFSEFKDTSSCFQLCRCMCTSVPDHNMFARAVSGQCKYQKLRNSQWPVPIPLHILESETRPENPLKKNQFDPCP